MSQSGIPIVSDLAQAAHNITASVGDIFAGKNAFEALGRIAAAPMTLAGSTWRSSTFGLTDQVPVLGDWARDSQNFAKNPYSADQAKYWAGSTAKAAAVVGGSIVAAPFVGAQLGLGTTASYALTGTTIDKITKGDFAGAAAGATGAVGNYLGGTDLGKAYADVSSSLSPYTDAVKDLIAMGNKPASTPYISPVNNVSQAAQNTILKSGVSTNNILLIAAAGFAVVLFLKMEKVI